jgi:DNA polymerase-3 subunit gamma/tau
VKFIFATTEPQKIPITILSRCQRFDFAGINSTAIQTRLRQIAQAEGVEIEAEAVQIIAARAAGSMRDSQSLLEQLLAVAGERITANDVNQLLGIAPAERLSGLVRFLVARDAAAALAELNAAIHEGVEVGQFLDQLVGYFRDVMAATVGCGAEQMLYALPLQVEEVKDVGRRLGLQTILAIAQILDQTVARMRLSIHGRTLAEMAVVRICQLEDFDDLATLVAELRGEGGQTTGNVAQSRPAIPKQPQVVAQKNDGPPPGSLAASLEQQISAMGDSARGIPPQSPASQATGCQPLSTPSGDDSEELRPAADKRVDPTAAVGSGENLSTQSVLKQFQQAITSAPRSSGEKTPPARVSHRERMATLAEQPFVKRAMELFDVPPDKMRHLPPEIDAR